MNMYVDHFYNEKKRKTLEVILICHAAATCGPFSPAGEHFKSTMPGKFPPSNPSSRFFSWKTLGWALGKSSPVFFPFFPVSKFSNQVENDFPTTINPP